jgi:tRNA pseudouridine38-40 synthase
MPNYKLTIEYEGTNYHGWQRQKTKVTVQEIIEKTLEKIFNQKITLIGQGRIDAGAHALGQVANFKVKKNFKPLNLKKALNSMLPLDIRINDVQVADDKFHARYQAKMRHYKYLVYNDEKSVWSRNFAYSYPYELDIKKMNEAAKYLIGKHDFSPFQTTGSPAKTPVKTIKLIKIARENFFFFAGSNFPVIRFDIKADAFLYKMVRNIIGALFEVGRGKIPPAEISDVINKNEKRKGQAVPACGLYLVDVKY